ncbi:MAG: hypothetical protein JSU95_15990 [Betaproteobacteria bacterium]|nr:MAG: hypothetical protein JSU95_15990 [Betaproteobacteria bacterium]
MMLRNSRKAMGEAARWRIDYLSGHQAPDDTSGSIPAATEIPGRERRHYFDLTVTST